MPVALDTNILIYAEGVDGEAKRNIAIAALRPFGTGEVHVPVQALGEFFAVLTRKARWPATEAREAVTRWMARALPIPTTATVLEDAMTLAVAHRLASWDAVILAAAAEAGCEALLTEDLHPGFAWRGCVVRNPFSA